MTSITTVGFAIIILNLTSTSLIRSFSDPQRHAYLWRCSTYSALGNCFPLPSSSHTSNSFADDGMRSLTSLVSSLSCVTTNVFPPKFLGELVSIGKEAYG